MKALIINCSPVRTGATAEIVKLVSLSVSEAEDFTRKREKKHENFIPGT